MAVCHEDVAVRANGHARRAIEYVRSITAHPGLAKRHQQLTFGADLENCLTHPHALRRFRGHAENGVLVVRVGRPEVPVLIYSEPVRMREEADAEASDQSAGGAELQDRRVGVTAI